MSRIFSLCIISILMVTFQACNSSSKKTIEVMGGNGNSTLDTVVETSYAEGFTVKNLENGVHLVSVSDPQKDEDLVPISYQFALIPKGVEYDAPEGYTPVQVPISRTIVMTMLQLSNFTALDAHEVVKGITGTRNLFDADMNQRVNDGRTVKIGMEGNFDVELILAANPDVIFISPSKRGGYESIKETGITLVPHLGYKELDPLGQAEWIKFIGMFIGKEKEANEIFAGIESRYNDLKEKAAKVANRPTVTSGEMHYGNWHAVGGKNYLAQIFRDAGADYVINDDEESGEDLEFEKMYALSANADYWRILNSFDGEFTYEALKAKEPRNEMLKAFKEKKVIYCNMKQTPYYEIEPVKPDVLLKDLIAIFHPELVEKDYTPTFYRLLK